MRKKNKSSGESVTNYPPIHMADVIGLRLFNSIDVAARRPTKQHQCFTMVDFVDPGKFTLLDVDRVEAAVEILRSWILGSGISLELGRWKIVKPVGKRGYRAYSALKIRASYGEDLPLADANLAPVRREYRRLMKERSKK